METTTLPTVFPTDEMVDDILSAALEGGSNYWIDHVDVVGERPAGISRYGGDPELFLSEVLTHGVELDVYAVEEPAPDRLTLAKMQCGIQQAARFYGLTVERFYEDHDAGMADVAVQFALFDEVIYG